MNWWRVGWHIPTEGSVNVLLAKGDIVCAPEADPAKEDFSGRGFSDWQAGDCKGVIINSWEGRSLVYISNYAKTSFAWEPAMVVLRYSDIKPAPWAIPHLPNGRLPINKHYSATLPLP